MGGSSSKQTSSAFPSWAVPVFKEDVLPFARSLTQQYAAQNGQTPLRTAGENTILGTARGDYLTPESNPYLKSTADAISRAAGENLDRSLNRVGQSAELGGSLFSTKTNQQKLDTVRSGNQDVTDRLTNLYAGNYGAERTNQLNAAGTASTMDLNRLVQFLDLLKGSESSTKQSSWNIL